MRKRHIKCRAYHLVRDEAVKNGVEGSLEGRRPGLLNRLHLINRERVSVHDGVETLKADPQHGRSLAWASAVVKEPEHVVAGRGDVAIRWGRHSKVIRTVLLKFQSDISL